MFIYIVLIISLVLNALLGWYISRILQKFIFISDNMSDLFLTTKAFHVFVKDMYSMDSFHGEPIIQELVLRIKEVNEEIIGEFFSYFILETAMTGKLLGINPFDQPAVEQVKIQTEKLLSKNSKKNF